MDINQIYSALSHAETGSFDNPWIRTVAKNVEGGSSAFGPVQITGSLAKGASKNGYLSEDTNKFYSEVMAPMYEKMLYHGNMKGKIKDFDKKFDYGGGGGFDSKKNSEQYEKFAKEIIAGIIKEAKGDEEEFVRKWRGKTEKEDPEYFERYKKGKTMSEIGDELVRQLTR